MRYAGKIVLVTGARRGVGRLLAGHFLREGAQVIGFSRHADDGLAHESYTDIEVDVGDADAVARGFEQVRKTVGRVDIVINNAAVLTSQYSMIMPPAAARSMFETNLFGTFMVSREAAKLMRKGKWGRIINIGSMAASLEPIGDSVYAATKAAVATLANVMAKEFAPLNITCNTLGITAIETDMLGQLPRDKVDAVIAGLPMPRYARADDIFNVVDFFASERSSYVTAQTVFLGGVN
ncbi:SDR family oxidoreductase [Roseateles sp.]|uniref:SDR family NAD(P)-dependent oxidoreductase n=1 Tax=Roseateles sp. TaxID=1971397 RepID=UPI003266D4F4